MSTEEKKNAQCVANKPDGSRCQVSALSGSDFCFFHAPSTAVERKAAQSLGGQGNRMKVLDPGTPDVKIENTRDLLDLLSLTMSQVRTGRIDPKTATTLGYLLDIAMRLIRQNENDIRLRRLEALFEKRKGS